MTTSSQKWRPEAVRDLASFPPGFDMMKLQISEEQNNRGLEVEFFLETLEREDLVNEENGEVTKREPLQEERIRIRVAGDSCNEFVGPVSAEHRERFKIQYQSWKGDHEARAVASRRATPLKSWDEPGMTPAFANDLERLNILSVESLAYLPDSAVTKFPRGRMWRDRALAFLSKANEDARFGELRDENAALRAQVDQITAQAEETQRMMRKLLGETGPAGPNGSKAQ
jgi:hypothetical protein